MKFYTMRLMVMSCALMLSAQGYARYKSEPFQPIYQEINMLAPEFVGIRYQVLTARECKKYFNSTSLFTKGYQPILFSFINNSKRSFSVGIDSFSFRCAHYQDVANSLHRNGVWRGVGFGLGALLFSPLIIPAFVQALGAQDYNTNMNIDFSGKAFKKQVVAPYGIAQGVLFVAYDQFTTDFTVIVTDIEHKTSLMISSLNPQVMVSEKKLKVKN